jgi:Phage integrase family.
MTNNPWKTVQKKMLSGYSAVWNSEYIKSTDRRLNRMFEDFKLLEAQGHIRTTNPKEMNAFDIKSYIEFRRSQTSTRTGEELTEKEHSHDLTALKHIVGYPYEKVSGNRINICSNTAVEHCLKLFPYLKPYAKRKRFPPLSKFQRDSIFALSHYIPRNDHRRIRAYALAAFSLSASNRNKEIRLARVQDIDWENWEFMIKHPKGEKTYGEGRFISIENDAHHIMKMYVDHVLPEWKRKHPEFSDTDVLFPSYLSRDTDNPFLTSKQMRKILRVVEADVGFTVTYQITRRTYSQMLFDRKVPGYVISVMLGHNDDRTVYENYGRMTQNMANEIVRESRTGNETKGVESDFFNGCLGKRMSAGEGLSYINYPDIHDIISIQLTNFAPILKQMGASN